MEPVSKKRKKRKTRKCLDELRRKTHQSNDVCKMSKNTGNKSNKGKSNCTKSNYITSNRLTMLRNSVRSETITRSQLYKSKELKTNKDTKTITSNCCANVDVLLEHVKNKTVFYQDKHISKDSSEVEVSPNINNENVNDEIYTPKSTLLFTPESQNDEEIKKAPTGEKSLDIQETSSISSTSTMNSTNHMLYTDKIYNGIELHIQEKFPHLLESAGIIIKEMEAELAKLCFEAKCKSQTSKNITFSADKQNSSLDELLNNPLLDKQYLSNSSHNEQCQSNSSLSKLLLSNPLLGKQYLSNSSPNGQYQSNSSLNKLLLSNPLLDNEYSRHSSLLKQYSSHQSIQSPLNSSPNLPFIQNPRDYIEYLRSQSQSSQSTPTMNDVTPRRVVDSDSSVSIYIQTPSPITSAIFDTPEYSYYPHRLN